MVESNANRWYIFKRWRPPPPPPPPLLLILRVPGHSFPFACLWNCVRSESLLFEELPKYWLFSASGGLPNIPQSLHSVSFVSFSGLSTLPHHHYKHLRPVGELCSHFAVAFCQIFSNFKFVLYFISAFPTFFLPLTFFLPVLLHSLDFLSCSWWISGCHTMSTTHHFPQTSSATSAKPFL